MYVTSSHDDVFALDATTGKQLWAHHPQFKKPLEDLSICCGRDNRGVAYGNGKIFLARLDGVLEALDATTGEPLWQTIVVNSDQRYSLTLAPQFAKGMV